MVNPVGASRPTRLATVAAARMLPQPIARQHDHDGDGSDHEEGPEHRGDDHGQNFGSAVLLVSPREERMVQEDDEESDPQAGEDVERDQPHEEAAVEGRWPPQPEIGGHFWLVPWGEVGRMAGEDGRF